MSVTQPPAPQSGGRLRQWAKSAQMTFATWLRGHPKLARVADIVAQLIIKQSDYRLSLTAAGTSFWLVLASFPAAIAAVTVYGLLAAPDNIDSTLKQFETDIPANFQALLNQQVQQAAQVDSGPLTIGLVASLVLTLWSASTGAYALLRVIRLAYGLPPQGYVIARIRGVGLTLVGLVALLSLTIVITLFNQALLDLVRSLGWLGYSLAAVVAITVLALVILVVIRFAIARRTPLRSMLLGTVLATTATTVFVLFVVTIGDAVADYQAVYGAVSTIAAALLAGYAVIYALLLSVLFNALAFPLPFSGAPADQSEKQLLSSLQSVTNGSEDADDTFHSDQSPD